MFPPCYHGRMKRVLAGILVLGFVAASVYGYTISRREQRFSQLLADGDAALSRDDPSAAIEDFSVAIALKNDAMAGYLKRGQAYRRRGEYEAAIRDLRRASELDSTATRPHEELGDVQLALKRYGSAAEAYRDYVRLDPPAPRVLYKLAFARYEEGHLPQAIDSAQKAIALDNRLPEAYYVLGLCQRDLQHLEAARRALEQSIALEPTLLHAREELADLDAALGRNEDQLAQLEALGALDPRPSRDVALGVAYAHEGEPERAVLTLGRAAQRYPDYPAAYVALGRVWLEIAEQRNDRVALSKALGALEAAVGNDDSSEALMLLGRGLLLTGDAESAERMLEDATEKRPIDPRAFYYLADAAERLGHVSTARQALLDYDTLRGEDPDPRVRSAEAVRIGNLSLKMGDPASASRAFLRAASNAGGDASLLVRAADAQWRSGDRAGARATLARALDKNPHNSLALALKRSFAR
jgi:tetratricopeptide (TPR) repeat protein